MYIYIYGKYASCSRCLRQRTYMVCSRQRTCSEWGRTSKNMIGCLCVVARLRPPLAEASVKHLVKTFAKVFVKHMATSRLLSLIDVVEGGPRADEVNLRGKYTNIKKKKCKTHKI